jgi:putative spermidine/putrescine transport system ATP-binding protein
VWKQKRREQKTNNGYTKVKNIKLSVRNLEKVYGNVTALKDANLDLFEGEFLTLLGPSGSGKTTLLMLIAGLIQPTDGSIIIDGKVSTYLPPHRRDLGLVFQSYALFPHLTIFDNIAFPLRMRKVSESEIKLKVNEILEVVQLEHTSYRFPRELSGGQQQRIALARCMVYRPSIILMDEPLGALDRRLRDRMQIEIKHLQKKMGITVLYVTHDQDEAMSMSDRICLMNNAKIEQIGTPTETYFSPMTIFAAEFLGDSNLLNVELVSDGEVQKIKFGDNYFCTSKPFSSDIVASKLLIRPESIRILTDNELEDNAIKIQIKEVILSSGYRKVYGTTPCGNVILFKMPLLTSASELRTSDVVRIGWSKDQCLILQTGA